LFGAVNPDELRSGAAAGFLASAATAGTLIAIGRRIATASRPFNIIASHVVGSRAAGAFGFVPLITISGVVLHIVITTLLGMVTLSIVRRRLLSLWQTSAGLSLLSALISIGIARRGGASLAALFPTGDLLVYYIVLAAGLILGIRFALPKSALD
jgi:hypothetical protein